VRVLGHLLQSFVTRLHYCRFSADPATYSSQSLLLGTPHLHQHHLRTSILKWLAPSADHSLALKKHRLWTRSSIWTCWQLWCQRTSLTWPKCSLIWYNTYIDCGLLWPHAMRTRRSSDWFTSNLRIKASCIPPVHDGVRLVLTDSCPFELWIVNEGSVSAEVGPGELFGFNTGSFVDKPAGAG